MWDVCFNTFWALILFVLAAETDDFDHLSIDHTEVKLPLLSH